MKTDSKRTNEKLRAERQKATVQPIKIMVIEDNRAVMNLLRDMLEQEGWLVEGFADGSAAMERLGSDEQYDLIITDNDLPGLCGLELIRRARNMPRYQRTPIIIVSSDLWQAEAELAGADEFLRKPEDIFAIPRTVGRLLGFEISTDQ